MSDDPFSDFSPDDLKRRKREFARHLLKYPLEVSEAAFRAFPDQAHTALALIAAKAWPRDFDVTTMKAAILKKEGATAALTDREETARQLLTVFQDVGGALKERLQAADLYARVLGYHGRSDGSTKVDLSKPIEDLFARIEADGRPKPRGTL